MSDFKGDIKPKQCFTVADVIEALSEIPSDTTVQQGFGKGVDVVFFNQGVDNPHVSFEDGGDWNE